MFGYVKPLKDELKVYQLTVFKSYYCGLCQHIKKDFGELPRFVLNYDLTALALLLDGLSDSKTYMRDSICITSPVKKKPMIVANEALSYAACMNVSLVYYKLLDDVLDDGDLKSKVLAESLKPYTKKFPPQVLPINRVIHKELQALHKLESEKTFFSLDEISHPFAEIVGRIVKDYPYALKNDTPALRESLYQFGYALGKWIYMIDALDDLEKDMKEGNFNPINVLYNQDDLPYDELLARVGEQVSFTLLNCGYRCMANLRKLPLVRNRAILHNIVSLGMMEEYTKVTSHCGCQTKCQKKSGV
ncbi:MAG: DUF5685 family protein [Cellulosilyticaceae bacterium]